jgi:hypothetical protein
VRSLILALLIAPGCASRPLPFPLDAPDLGAPDLLPMRCGGTYAGPRAGAFDPMAGCSVFVVDDNHFSIFSLDTFAGADATTAHASLSFPPEIAVRSYTLADVTLGRVSLDDGAGNTWTAGVSASSGATGTLSLRIDQVGDQQLDARGRYLFVVHGALDATLLSRAQPPAADETLHVSF